MKKICLFLLLVFLPVSVMAAPVVNRSVGGILDILEAGAAGKYLVGTAGNAPTWESVSGITITASQVSDFNTEVSNNAAVMLNTVKITERTTVSTPLVKTNYDLSIPVATSIADGYLNKDDWTTFNGKAGIASPTFTGTVTIPTVKITNGAQAGYRLQSAADGTSTWVDPGSGLTYLGGWDATTNVPVLTDAGGSNGDMYAITVSGTQDLGTGGSIDWTAGGFAIHNGTQYEEVVGVATVTSVNGKTGVVTLEIEKTGNDINIEDNATTIDIGMDVDDNWTAAGDLVYGTGTDTAAILSMGTAGQVLSVNHGATAALEWFDKPYTQVTTGQGFYDALAASTAWIMIMEDIDLSEGLYPASQTIPAGTKVSFFPGKTITTATYTLTVNGTIDAGRYKIFNAAPGEVIFGDLADKVYPEWWASNIIPGTTDMAPAIQAAVSAVGLLGIPIVFGPTTYKVATGLTILNRYCQIVGSGAVNAGSYQSIIYGPGLDKIITLGNGTESETTDARYFQMRNIKILGNSTTNYGIYANDYSNLLKFVDVIIERCTGTPGVGLFSDDHGYGIIITRCSFIYNDTGAQFEGRFQGTIFNDSKFYGNSDRQLALYNVSGSSYPVSGIYLFGCDIENVSRNTDGLVIRGIAPLLVSGCYFESGFSDSDKACIVFDTTPAASLVKIDNMIATGNSDSDYGIRFPNDNSVINLELAGSRFTAFNISSIYAPNKSGKSISISGMNELVNYPVSGSAYGSVNARGDAYGSASFGAYGTADIIGLGLYSTLQSWDVFCSTIGIDYLGIRDVTNSKTPFKVESDAATNTLVIDSNSRVGIGTAAPSTKLHVIGTVTATSFSGNTLYAANNLGIGTNSPTEKLDISYTAAGNSTFNSTTISGIRLYDTDTTGGYKNQGIIFSTGAGEPAFIGAHRTGASSNVLKFGTNDIVRMTIDTSGDIDVTGDFTAVGNISSSGGTCCADYVFDADYDLPTLEEVEMYVADIGHLPGMTQGVGTEIKPLNLTKAISELIVKTEEQSLYIQQLHKRLSELEGGS